jgi:hypothetical protein
MPVYRSKKLLILDVRLYLFLPNKSWREGRAHDSIIATIDQEIIPNISMVMLGNKSNTNCVTMGK